MKKYSLGLIILVLLSLLITSGCTATPTESNNPSATSGTESKQAAESTKSDELQDLPAEYLKYIKEGWKTPTNADLQGTAWGWDDYQDDLGYRSKLIAFNEWTVDVIWNDGIDENAHKYPDAAYELKCENDVAALEIDFREMAGKLSYYLLLSPNGDSIYTLEISSDGNTDSQPVSALLNKKKTANYMEMIGKWERTRTMVEGEAVESEPNICTIEISGESKNTLKINYNSKEFAQNSYSDKNLIFSLGPLPIYTDCGNDVWYADIDYVGEFSTTYAITLLADGTLLLQNYFTIDGAPAVSYEWFKRVS